VPAIPRLPISHGGYRSTGSTGAWVVATLGLQLRDRQRVDLAFGDDDHLPGVAAMAVGYRARLGDNWDWDVSVNHGRNDFRFHESNTVNVSWWYEPAPGGGIYAQSPTEADTGTLKFRQARPTWIFAAC
jgi:hypothetical protein